MFRVRDEVVEGFESRPQVPILLSRLLKLRKKGGKPLELLAELKRNLEKALNWSSLYHDDELISVEISGERERREQALAAVLEVINQDGRERGLATAGEKMESRCDVCTRICGKVSNREPES